MSIQLEVKDLIATVASEWRLPKVSLLRELPTLNKADESEVEASLLRIQVPADEHDTTRIAWLKWYQSHPAPAVTAKVTDSDGTTQWFDIWPARDPAAPYEWVVVVHSTVDALLAKMQIGRTVTLSCITDSCRALAKKHEDKKADSEEVKLLDIKADLHAKIRSRETGAPKSPEAVFEWYVGKANQPGKCGELCAAWEAYLNHPKNPLNPTYRNRVLQSVAAVRDLLSRASLRPQRPLDALYRVAQAVESIDDEFRASWRNTQREAAGLQFTSPNYNVTIHQLLGELQAFSIAARKAAMHETVFGSLIESRITELIIKAVHPLSVSSGALAGAHYPHQIDVLVWNHQLLPPVIQHGPVAVVPPTSVAGILEVKAGADLGEFAMRIEQLRDELAILRNNSVVQTIGVPVLGLVIVDDQTYAQVRSGSRNHITSLFRRKKLFDYEPNPEGVSDLLVFLYNEVLPVSRASATQFAGQERIQQW